MIGLALESTRRAGFLLDAGALPFLTVAQIGPGQNDPTSLGQWLINLAAFLVIVAAGVRIYRDVTSPRQDAGSKSGTCLTKPACGKDPADIATVAELNRRESFYSERFNGLSRKIDGLRDEFHDGLRDLRDESSSREKSQTQWARDVMEAIGGLKEAIRNGHRRVASFGPGNHGEDIDG